MSCVTNVIILTSLLEEEGESGRYPAIAHLDRYLEENVKGIFIEISGWAGGRKAMERLVFAGAFNGLLRKEFLTQCATAPWFDRESVQVLISEHEQDGFSLLWGIPVDKIEGFWPVSFNPAQ